MGVREKPWVPFTASKSMQRTLLVTTEAFDIGMIAGSDFW